jgi:transcriptional regulator with XRE-family HTH domain
MPESHLIQTLRREMEKRGHNQNSLALAAGLQKDAVRNILRGTSASPRGKTIHALASYLGISVTALLGEEMGEMPATPRLPGRRPGLAERAELVRLWDALDPEAQKMMIFMARAIARETGAIPPQATLLSPASDTDE